MTKIFFWSPSGYGPLKAARLYLMQSHGWLVGDGVYGVAVPLPTVCPAHLGDVLGALGVHVLPSVHDDSTDIHPDVHTALAPFGVVAGDTAHTIAKKMYAASGMPSLRPHLY